MTPKTFETWMKEVDDILFQSLGLTSLGIPDQSWWDWWFTTMSPRQAVRRALANEGMKL